MKKIVLILGMLASVPSFAVIQRLGSSLDTTDPEKEFIKIKNTEASTSIVSGNMVCLDTSADDGVSAKLCTTGGAPALCVGIDTILAGAYGRCQIYGFHAAVLVSAAGNNVTAGGRLAVSSDGTASKADGKSTGDLVGIALDSASTSTTVKAFIKL